MLGGPFPSSLTWVSLVAESSLAPMYLLHGPTVDEWGQFIPIPQLRFTNGNSSWGQAGRVWTWVTWMKRVHEPRVLVTPLCSLLRHNSWRARGSSEFVWKYLGRLSLLTCFEAPSFRQMVSLSWLKFKETSRMNEEALYITLQPTASLSWLYEFIVLFLECLLKQCAELSKQDIWVFY